MNEKAYEKSEAVKIMKMELYRHRPVKLLVIGQQGQNLGGQQTKSLGGNAKHEGRQQRQNLATDRQRVRHRRPLLKCRVRTISRTFICISGIALLNIN